MIDRNIIIDELFKDYEKEYLIVIDPNSFAPAKIPAYRKRGTNKQKRVIFSNSFNKLFPPTLKAEWSIETAQDLRSYHNLP